MRNIYKVSGALFAAAMFGGCTQFQPPQPWERGLLAKSEMSLQGDPLQQRFDQHVYTSKENASGGSAIGGGGCGCN